MGLPICTICDVERVLTGIEPARRNYVIRTFQCPSCQSVLKIVGKVDEYSDLVDRPKRPS
jgi:uncharacterized protein YlaI